jgi:hypothetical protein
MKTLPPPAARKPVHTRTVTFEGYSREDGLWDVEAEMRDTKAYSMETLDRVALRPGQPIHHMKIRMTLDDDYVIRDLHAVTIDAPFGECQAGVPPLQQMVGVRVGKGWREVIESRLCGGAPICASSCSAWLRPPSRRFRTTESTFADPCRPRTAIRRCSWAVASPGTSTERSSSVWRPCSSAIDGVSFNERVRRAGRPARRAVRRKPLIVSFMGSIL